MTEPTGSTRPGRGARHRGQATVELALGLPVVCIGVLLVLQLALVGRDAVLVAHAAREAARAAAVDPTRRAAEIRARKLPVLLLFPLVLCTLPAFGLLTVAPLVAGTFDSLSGGHLEAPASLGP